MNPTTRIIGAIALWSVEIVMQLRIYALFGSSKKVALVNAVLFLGSVTGFIYVLVHNVSRTQALIADAVHLPLPGCPSVHLDTEWAQWVPATAYEGILFSFAVYKAVSETAHTFQGGKRISLYSLLIRDNLLYFFSISCILVFNNLMVVGVTRIPWFSFGPFHAAVGILTVRMLLNLRKATAQDIDSFDLNEIHVDDFQRKSTDEGPGSNKPSTIISMLRFQRSTEVSLGTRSTISTLHTGSEE